MHQKNLSRRAFLRIVGVAAATTVVVACAPGSAPSGATGAEGAPSSEAIVLRYHHRLGTECDNHGSWADKFKETHPDVEVKLECFPGADYFKKLNTLIAGGTIGDGFWISSIEGFYRLAASGACAPLDDIVSERQFDLSQFYAQNIEAAKLKGVLYGLPQLAHPGRVGLFYSRKLFQEKGLEEPNDTWTYDNLLEAAQQLSDADNQVFGFQPGTDYFSLLVDQRAWGGDMLNEDGTKAALNSAESVQALEFVSDLFHVHKVAPSPSQNLSQEQLFKSGKLAMFQSGFWGGYIKNFTQPEEWGVAPMPIGASGKRGSMFESDPVCVSKSSQHPAEMFDFFTLFTTNEAQKQNYERMSATSVRPEVMADPEIQKDTIMKVFGGVMADAGPLVLPANFRETEYFKTIDERLQLVWLGEQTVAEMIDALQDEAQSILDKPSLEANG